MRAGGIGQSAEKGKKRWGLRDIKCLLCRGGGGERVSRFDGPSSSSSAFTTDLSLPSIVALRCVFLFSDFLRVWSLPQCQCGSSSVFRKNKKKRRKKREDLPRHSFSFSSFALPSRWEEWKQKQIFLCSPLPTFFTTAQKASYPPLRSKSPVVIALVTSPSREEGFGGKKSKLRLVRGIDEKGGREGDLFSVRKWHRRR